MLKILSGIVLGVMIVVPQTRDQVLQIAASVWSLIVNIAHILIGAIL